MTRTEFLERTKPYHGSVNGWDIVLDRLSVADFVLGCYYDESDKKWKVYENGERGVQDIDLETTSEEEALDELYSNIEYKNRTYLHCKEWEAKNKNRK